MLEFALFSILGVLQSKMIYSSSRLIQVYVAYCFNFVVLQFVIRLFLLPMHSLKKNAFVAICVVSVFSACFSEPYRFLVLHLSHLVEMKSMPLLQLKVKASIVESNLWCLADMLAARHGPYAQQRWSTKTGFFLLQITASGEVYRQ